MTAIWFAIVLAAAAWSARLGMAAMVGVCFVLSSFQAAAALSFGGLYLQPAYVFLGLMVATIAWRATDRTEAAWLFHAARLNALTLVFGAYCVMSAIVYPRIFGGMVVVYPLQSSEFPGQELARFYLRPEPTNINQSGYSVLCMIASVCATYAAARESTLAAVRRAVPISVAVIAAIGIVQWAVRFVGLPFKPALLYNNAGVALLLEQQFGAIPRINATFIEPSSLAVGLAPLVAYLLTVAIIDHDARRFGLLALAGSAILILSTSTTAYLGLGVAMISTIVILAMHERGRFLPGALVLGLAMLAVLALIGVSLWALFPALRDPILSVFNATVTDKGASGSAIERGNWNAQAWANLFATYGLGTGFGSSRASGLVFVLLGTTGLPGLLLFVAMVGQALLPGRHDAGIWSPDLAALKAGVLTAAVTLMVSGAELTSMPFWLMLGTLAVNRLPAEERVRQLAWG